MKTESEHGRRWLAGLFVICLASAPWPGDAGAAEDDDATLALPTAIDKVWLRTDKAGWAGVKSRRSSGDLIITEEALDFGGQKKAFYIPLDAIVMVSLGKLKNDVNTDWVVLRLEELGATRRVAPGDSVVHPVWLVNHTGATTSFDLSLSGHRWPSFLSSLRTPSMADGESIRFDVHVTVSEGAVGGDADSVTVTAVSGDLSAGAAPAAVYHQYRVMTALARPQDEAAVG